MLKLQKEMEILNSMISGVEKRLHLIEDEAIEINKDLKKKSLFEGINIISKLKNINDIKENIEKSFEQLDELKYSLGEIDKSLLYGNEYYDMQAFMTYINEKYNNHNIISSDKYCITIDGSTDEEKIYGKPFLHIIFFDNYISFALEWIGELYRIGDIDIKENKLVYKEVIKCHFSNILKEEIEKLSVKEFNDKILNILEYLILNDEEEVYDKTKELFCIDDLYDEEYRPTIYGLSEAYLKGILKLFGYKIFPLYFTNGNIQCSEIKDIIPTIFKTVSKSLTLDIDFYFLYFHNKEGIGNIKIKFYEDKIVINTKKKDEWETIGAFMYNEEDNTIKFFNYYKNEFILKYYIPEIYDILNRDYSRGLSSLLTILRNAEINGDYYSQYINDALMINNFNYDDKLLDPMVVNLFNKLNCTDGQ